MAAPAPISIVAEAISNGDLKDAGATRAADYSLLLVSPHSATKNIVVAIEKKSGRPAFVAKIGVGEFARAGVAAEFRALQMLEGARSKAFPIRAPRAFGYRDCGRVAVHFQEALAGETLFHAMRECHDGRKVPLKGIVHRLLDWEGHLNALPAPPEVSIEAARARWMADWASFANAPGVRRDLGESCYADITATLSELVAATGRTVFQHGDLFLRNILLQREGTMRGIALIDWADSAWDLPPLFDVIMLFGTLWTAGKRQPTEKERLAHFRKVFSPQSPWSEELQRAILQAPETWQQSVKWGLGAYLLMAMARFRARLVAQHGEGSAEVALIEMYAREVASQESAATTATTAP